MSDTPSLKDRLQSAMKDAMRAKAKERLGTIRMIQAGVKRKEIDDRVELDDAGVLAVIEKMLKQCKDSQQQYQDAGREDLAAKEAGDIAVLEEFMPAQMSEAEVDQAIRDAIAEVGASSAADMGKVMKVLTPQLKGRADMGAVSGRVKAQLSG